MHQEPHGKDFENRVSFCWWFLRIIDTNDVFLQNVLFTDEITFINHGQVNVKNMHYWSVENHH